MRYGDIARHRLLCDAGLVVMADGKVLLFGVACGGNVLGLVVHHT